MVDELGWPGQALCLRQGAECVTGPARQLWFLLWPPVIPFTPAAAGFTGHPSSQGPRLGWINSTSCLTTGKLSAPVVFQ